MRFLSLVLLFLFCCLFVYENVYAKDFTNTGGIRQSLNTIESLKPDAVLTADESTSNPEKFSAMDFLNKYTDENRKYMSLSVSWSDVELDCDMVGAYWVSLEFPGKEGGEFNSVSLALQTYTKAQMEKIYTAIRDNFNKKFLPKCVLEDTFFGVNKSYIFKHALTQPVGKYTCTSPKGKIYRHVTKCVFEDNIYE